ncbi:MAG: hypothetical protein AAF485_17710 [Chloroflexota bacterium]
MMKNGRMLPNLLGFAVDLLNPSPNETQQVAPSIPFSRRYPNYL